MPLHCHANLMQIVDALRPVGHFTKSLDSREEHGGQDRDDADDHQQFEECEPATPP
jgi:hypothetical protein